LGWPKVKPTPGSEFEEFPWGSSEDLGAARGYQGIVFDPDSPNPFDVNPRFQGHYVSSLQNPLLPSSDPGIFMDFQANPMPGAMNKVSP
jgi:hypothetical protein